MLTKNEDTGARHPCFGHLPSKFCLLVFIAAFAPWAQADEWRCKQTLAGARFLHQTQPQLFQSPFVENIVTMGLRSGDRIPNTPEARIAYWLTTFSSALKDPQRKHFLKEQILTHHVIRQENIPESYFALRQRIARERGLGTLELNEKDRRWIYETLVSNQRESLAQWIDYFLGPHSSQYPIALKVWAFQGLLKLGKYHTETNSFSRRSKSTVETFAELNYEAVGLMMDAVLRMLNEDKLDDIGSEELAELLQRGNFGQLYAYALRQAGTFEYDPTLTGGEWRVYEQNSDHMPLVNSLRGKATGWCTAGASTAATQLSGGDFYVYYSRDSMGQNTVPRIAIRMEGDKIAEVRGRATDQNLDPEIASTNILSDKLQEFGAEGEQYLVRVEHMKKLTEIEQKLESGEELDQEDLRLVYEIDEKIQGFGFQQDPRIREITENRNTRSDLAYIFDCEPSQISLSQGEALRGGVIYHRGDIELSGLFDQHMFTLPQIVSGNMFLSGLPSIEGLTLPQTVGGSLYLNGLTSAKGLTLPKSIGGNIYLERLLSTEGLMVPEGFSMGGNAIIMGVKYSEDSVIRFANGY